VTVAVGGLVEDSDDGLGSEPPHPASTAARTNKSVASTCFNRTPLRPSSRLLGAAEAENGPEGEGEDEG
jgi:hypothetical protein